MELSKCIPLLFLAVTLCGASRNCSIALTECPTKFATTTIAVSNEVIWLNPNVPYCNEPVQLSPSGPPTSIVFIIDNSGSMDENDPNVSRFKVVSSLLEGIFSVAPSTEVGLVIFTRRLAFDHRENSFFRTAFPEDTTQHDSFVPLTALNKSFPGGIRGLDTLRALLKHDALGNLAYVTKLPAARNNSGMGRFDTRNGTDISLGFQAAKLAMKDSKSDKSKHFFIFLSDGTPSTPDNGREGLVDEFITATATPPTMTVFFDSQHSPPIAPSTLVQMNNTLKANGYSINSAKSAYWAINTPGVNLEQILQVQVVGNIIFLPTTPKDAVVSVGEKTFYSSSPDAKSFIFEKPIPLINANNQILLNYTYTYTDTTGGASTPKSKLVPYLVNIQRTTHSAPNLGQGLVESCQESSDISLYHNGQKVSNVTADVESYEARLNLPAGQNCTECSLLVTASSALSKDSENVALTAQDGYLSTTFKQEINLVPTLGDGRLQHRPMDSIVFFWQNPDNSLDRIRKVFPYIDFATVVNVSRQNDFVKTENTPKFLASEWLLVGPANLQIEKPSGGRWRMYPGALTPEDSLNHIGVVLQASRAFKADIYIYTNLGQYVNKFSFGVSPVEFEKLPKKGVGSTRSMIVLWDSRTWDGHLVGTGAYVFQTNLTLLNIPGLNDDSPSQKNRRIVGVFRTH